MCGNIPGYRYIKSPYGLMAIQPNSNWMNVEGKGSIPFPENLRDADDKTIVNYAMDYINAKEREQEIDDEEEDDEYYFG